MRGEKLAQTQHERILVAGNDKIYIIVGHSLSDGGEIGRLDIDVRAIGGSTRIAGCNEKFAHQRALAKFPGQGAFTTAAAEQKYIHLYSNYELWIHNP